MKLRLGSDVETEIRNLKIALEDYWSGPNYDKATTATIAAQCLMDELEDARDNELDQHIEFGRTIEQLHGIGGGK